MHTPPRRLDGLFDISRLPTLPQTLIELIDACVEHDIDLQTVADIVGRDAAISARILQLANSAFLGSRTSFADIEQAVIYLGIDTVRNLAISVSVHEAFKTFSSPNGISLARFWHHSLLTAVLAKSLAELVSYPRPAEAYLAGLLHDLGKLLLSQARPEEYYDLVGDPLLDPSTLELLEKSRLGISHSEAGGLLVGRWNLEIPIATAIEQHHREDAHLNPAEPLADILFLANSLSMSGQPDLNHLENLARRMHVDLQALAGCLETAGKTVSAIAGSMGILIERPPEIASEDAAADNGRQELIQRIRTLSRLHGVLDNLVRAENPDRALKVIEESLHILFNRGRCLVFLPRPDRGGFIAHGSSINPLFMQIKGFEISSEEGRDILSPCAKSNSGFSILTRPAAKDQASPGKKLFSLLDSALLLTVVLPAGDWRGFLVAAIEEEQREYLYGCRYDLAFFARHAAARLYLDVISRKNAENLAGERVNAVQQITRSIAHEINNPLAIVQNYLSILGQRLTGQPEIQNELVTISREMARIACISRQLEDLSSQVSPHVSIPVEINALIRESLNLLQHSLFARQAISSHLDADPRIPPIMSDPEALRQILANLLKNAAEAISSDGKVWVRTMFLAPADQTGAAGVRITVEDNGPGITPRLADTLFGAGVSDKGDGHMGLGLAIAKKLVGELGGAISCSERAGGGACFTIELLMKI